jgi:hypothetical protein
MKRLIAAVSFALIAAPAAAQSFDRSPTDPVMPTYGVTERAQLAAAAGSTRSDVEIAAEARAGATIDDRNVERQPGYFDPSH